MHTQGLSLCHTQISFTTATVISANHKSAWVLLTRVGRVERVGASGSVVKLCGQALWSSSVVKQPRYLHQMTRSFIKVSHTTGKCKCLHTGSGNTGMNYEMGGTILSKTVKEKDLGVTMNANMKVSEQCRIAASKARRTYSRLHLFTTRLNCREPIGSRPCSVHCPDYITTRSTPSDSQCS